MAGGCLVPEVNQAYQLGFPALRYAAKSIQISLYQRHAVWFRVLGPDNALPEGVFGLYFGLGRICDNFAAPHVSFAFWERAGQSLARIEL